MTTTRPEAAFICIGDEILSGSVQDCNLSYLAKWLNIQGVELAHARIVTDRHEDIIEAVNELRDSYDYVVTSGGIGATHDDITAESISRAFKRKCIFDERALEMLTNTYARREGLTETRRLMARMPENADLIIGKNVGAPGFRVENVFVLAGVPSIFRAMLHSLAGEIKGDEVWCSRTIEVLCGETTIASQVAEIQQQSPDIRIGSYPKYAEEKGYYTHLVYRGSNQKAIDEVVEQTIFILKDKEIELLDLGYEKLQAS